MLGYVGYAKVMLRTSAMAPNVYLIALAGTSASGACARTEPRTPFSAAQDANAPLSQLDLGSACWYG
jgi:hypothetical protein